MWPRTSRRRPRWGKLLSFTGLLEHTYTVKELPSMIDIATMGHNNNHLSQNILPLDIASLQDHFWFVLC